MDIFTEPELLTEADMKTRLQGINIPSLSEQHKEILNRPFTAEKVKIAAFQIGPLKASGIDGNLASFTKNIGKL